MVSFGTNFMNLFNNVNDVVQYDTKHNAIEYIAIFQTVRNRFIHLKYSFIFILSRVGDKVFEVKNAVS